jgi:hypothetical protein
MRERSALFPDWVPNRREILSALTTALESHQSQIYLDASVLTLAYEITVGARTQMLTAFERFDTRVHVPMWAAHETWNNASKERDRPEHPFRGPQAAIKKAFQLYLKTTSSQLEEEFPGKNGTRSRSAFRDELKTLLDQTTALTRDIDPKRPESAAQQLHTFLDKYALLSNLSPIMSRAITEGPFRHAHGIPPGHGDARKARKSADGREETRSGSGNQFGDLIIWLEILEHANVMQAEEIVLITRDNTKEDWVYLPDRVLDDRGSRVENKSTTLPLPLLVSEARATCPKLKRLHIASLEDVARVLASRGENVSQLIFALQSEGFVDEPTTGSDRSWPVSAADASEASGPLTSEDVTFKAGDLAYEPGESEPVDQLIRALYTQDWSNQNVAARRVVTLNLERASRLQCIHLGISLARASNSLAVEPLDVLRTLLLSAEMTPTALNVMVGTLAEIYLTEEGELQVPAATPALSELVFDAAGQPGMRPAIAAVLDRLNAQRTRYLALPDEPWRKIQLEFGATRDGAKPELVSLRANAVELLEPRAPASRRLPSSGSGTAVTTERLVHIVSAEFGVPFSYLEADADPNMKWTLPDRLGFVLWGPGTGVELRREP